MNRTVPVYGALFALLLAAPFAVYPMLLMQMLCFALFACAFNLLLGFTGLLSFGHAAFFGAGAYTAGYVLLHLGVTPEIGLFAGTAAATALGAVFGALAIRRQGIYFAMITLALAQMVYFFCLQAPFTGGEDGLQGVPRGRLFGMLDLQPEPDQPAYALYYTVLAIFGLGFWLIHRAVHSPFGQVLKAIRENEPRTLSLGYEVDRYKLLAFTLSSGLSGLAGATKTLVLGFATLTDVHWQTSGEIVLMTLVGGVGTLLGPVIGAGAIVTLQHELADRVGPWVTVIMGAIFVVCVLLFRRGIVGEVAARLRSAKGEAGGNG
jgi:branched-chain amino acid transport system permease protein